MTITVRSNEKTETAPPAGSAAGGGPDPVDAKPSATEGDTSGQKKTPESETGEGDAKEGTDLEVEEPEEGAAVKDPEEKKKKSGFQKRIDKLNARAREKEQEADYWKREALKNATAPKSDAALDSNRPNAKPAAGDGKPNPENFDTHAAFVEALTDWKTDQKLNERDQKAANTRLQIEQNALAKTYNERRDAFAKKTPDFHEVISDVSDIPVSPAVREIIITSENGPELAYELAKNEENMARICKLPPLAAAREMGKIEAALASRASPESKIEKTKVTNAPPPVKPVGGGGKAGAFKSLHDVADRGSQADYEAMRKEQFKKRRQAS